MYLTLDLCAQNPSFMMSRVPHGDFEPPEAMAYVPLGDVFNPEATEYPLAVCKERGRKARNKMQTTQQVVLAAFNQSPTAPTNGDSSTDVLLRSITELFTRRRCLLFVLKRKPTPQKGPEKDRTAFAMLDIETVVV